jgi:hypothetical protein
MKMLIKLMDAATGLVVAFAILVATLGMFR